MNAKIWNDLKSVREIAHRRDRARHKRAIGLYPGNSTFSRLKGMNAPIPKPAVKRPWWRGIAEAFTGAWFWLTRRA